MQYNPVQNRNLRLMSQRRGAVSVSEASVSEDSPLVPETTVEEQGHSFIWSPRSGTQVQRTSLALVGGTTCLPGTRCLTPTGLHGWLMLRHNLKLVF